MIRIINLGLLLIVIPASGLSAQGLVALKKETQRFADPTENVADLVVEIRDNLWKEVLLVPDPNGQASGDCQTAGLLTGRPSDRRRLAVHRARHRQSIGPLLPAIFGMSLESGAITRTVSGHHYHASWPTRPGLVCASKAGATGAVALRDRRGVPDVVDSY